MNTGVIRLFSKSVPSIFTMMNLLSGCMAILLSFHDIALAGLMILLAGFFDFADGMAARLFNAYSEFGRELDSLADMVSFGVAPSFILFHLLKMSLIIINPVFSLELLSGTEIVVLASSFLPAVFASIRLAKFNMSADEKSFKGLPSPASGIFFASLGFIVLTTDTAWLRMFLLDLHFLLGINIVISVLMVLPVRMFTIKFENLGFSDNKLRYVFILPSFLAFVYWGIGAVPAITAWYILLSVIYSTLIDKSKS
jgi:CDP-diacylglycerol---serine O-phosphatidyltransferase